MSLGVFKAEAQALNHDANASPAASSSILSLLSKYLDSRPVLLNYLAVTEPFLIWYLWIFTLRHLIFAHVALFPFVAYWAAARYRFSPFAKYGWSRFGDLLLIVFWDRNAEANAPRRLKPGLQRLQERCISIAGMI